jgi:ABC-type Mn2+/Zn2+ transport system permease subunit
MKRNHDQGNLEKYLIGDLLIVSENEFMIIIVGRHDMALEQ